MSVPDPDEAEILSDWSGIRFPDGAVHRFVNVRMDPDDLICVSMDLDPPVQLVPGTWRRMTAADMAEPIASLREAIMAGALARTTPAVERGPIILHIEDES